MSRLSSKALYKVGTRLRKIIIFAEKNRWYDYEDRPLQLTLQGKTLTRREAQIIFRRTWVFSWRSDRPSS